MKTITRPAATAKLRERLRQIGSPAGQRPYKVFSNRAAAEQLARMGIDPREVGGFRAGPGTGTADPEKITIPDSPAGLEEMLADSKKMVALLGQPQGFEDFITAYATNVLKAQKTISDQVSEQVQQTLAKFLREADEDGLRPASPIPLDFASPAGMQASMQAAAMKAGLRNPRAMGSKIDQDYQGSADFFALTWHRNDGRRSARDEARLQRIRNAFDSTVPSEGGFLIPETLRSELLRVALETAIVRSRARVIPMESLRVPFPAIDSTSNVNSVYGGLVAYWTEEGAALTASQAQFGRVVLDAKKLTMYTEVPSELIADSAISFQAFLDNIFPEALAFYEDLAFLKGGGVGQPLGILSTNNKALISQPIEAAQTTASIVWENIIKMYARMLPGSLSRAVWVASIDTFPQLATMALSVGTGGVPVWLANGASDAPMTILGRPIVFTEKTPGILGSAGDLSFVDFGFYLIGDRQVMSSASSTDYKFGNDMTAFRIIERVDGRPWIQSPITPQNGGNTLSPFVQLAARP